MSASKSVHINFLNIFSPLEDGTMSLKTRLRVFGNHVILDEELEGSLAPATRYRSEFA